MFIAVYGTRLLFHDRQASSDKNVNFSKLQYVDYLVSITLILSDPLSLEKKEKTSVLDRSDDWTPV